MSERLEELAPPHLLFQAEEMSHWLSLIQFRVMAHKSILDIDMYTPPPASRNGAMAA